MENINNFEDVILVDENDNEIGTCNKLQAHKNPILHRAFSIFIFNTEGELLLQRRNKDKYHSGNLWTNTCCSHPQKDKELIHNASIRLADEMGILCPLKHLFSFCYKCKIEDLYEYEYDHVLIGFSNSTPHANKKEVSEWKWESLDVIKKQLEVNSEQYTYWFKYIIDNYYNVLKSEVVRYLENLTLSVKCNESFYFNQFQKDIEAIIHKELNMGLNLPEDLTTSINDCIQINGKCKRSKFLYLCNKLINDVDTNDLAYIAASIELMQNASLIHDDIIDNGDTRRGRETIYKKYGTNVAIINGDYVIFNSYNMLSRLSPKNEHLIVCIMKTLNSAYTDMCLGLRMEEKIIGNFSTDEVYYLELIKRKTASFFASVCSTGAILANASPKNIQLLQQFGYLYGLAYQIKDDLIPFINNSPKSNKDIDADLQNRMVTLPYIYCYNELSIQNQLLMKNHFEGTQDIEFNLLYDLVKSTTAINKCLILVAEYIHSALNILENFEDSEAKQELIQLTTKLLK